MADYKISGEILFTAANTTKTITIADFYQQYRVISSGALSNTAGQANTVRITGTPTLGTIVLFEYDADITLANSATSKVQFTFDTGIELAIIGDGSGALPAAYSNIKSTIEFKFDGSSWQKTINASHDDTGWIGAAMLASDAVTTAKILAENVTLAKIEDLARGSVITGQTASNRPIALDAKTSGAVLIGDGTDVLSSVVSGDIAIASTGVAAIQAGVIVNADISATAVIAYSKLAALTSTQIIVGSGANVPTAVTVTGDVTISNTGVTAIAAGVIEEADLTSNLTYEVIPLLVSFEAAGGTVPSVGDFKIKIPYPGTVTEIYAYAVKAIANTDAGTIQAKNNAGTNMTAGLVTFAISDARGTAYTVTPSADNTFIAGDILTFTTAKVTAGGLVQLSIKVTRT